MAFPGPDATLDIVTTVNANGDYVNFGQVTNSDQADPDSDPGTDETADDLADSNPDDDEVDTCDTRRIGLSPSLTLTEPPLRLLYTR